MNTQARLLGMVLRENMWSVSELVSFLTSCVKRRKRTVSDSSSNTIELTTKFEALHQSEPAITEKTQRETEDSGVNVSEDKISLFNESVHSYKSTRSMSSRLSRKSVKNTSHADRATEEKGYKSDNSNSTLTAIADIHRVEEAVDDTGNQPNNDSDTSSDSDDEILRQYKPQVNRTPSQHSLASRRSHQLPSRILLDDTLMQSSDDVMLAQYQPSVRRPSSASHHARLSSGSSLVSAQLQDESLQRVPSSPSFISARSTHSRMSSSSKSSKLQTSQQLQRAPSNHSLTSHMSVGEKPLQRVPSNQSLASLKSQKSNISSSVHQTDQPALTKARSTRSLASLLSYKSIASKLSKRSSKPIQRVPSNESIASMHSQKSFHSAISRISAASKNIFQSNATEQDRLVPLPEDENHNQDLSDTPRGSYGATMPHAHQDNGSVHSMVQTEMVETSIELTSGTTKLPDDSDNLDDNEYDGSEAIKSNHETGSVYSSAQSTVVQEVDEATIVDEEAEPVEEDSSLWHSTVMDTDTVLDDCDYYDEDIDSLHPEEHEQKRISECGSLNVTFDYDVISSSLTVSVNYGAEVPSKARGGADHTQVHMVLLPRKKVRFKTKRQRGDNPIYDECFSFNAKPRLLAQMGLRFRLYGCERLHRDRMLGEVVFWFSSFDINEPTEHTLLLEPVSNLTSGESELDLSTIDVDLDKTNSSITSHLPTGPPELLLGLSYNPVLGRLTVEVIKGTNFATKKMKKAPDSFVMLKLLYPNGEEIGHGNTTVRRNHPQPNFREKFTFLVPKFQVNDVTLMVCVYVKGGMKRKDLLGWFSVGNSSTGEEQEVHWKMLKEDTVGKQVTHWHTLLKA